MMRPFLHTLVRLSFVGLVLALPAAANAQILPIGTLQTNSTSVYPNPFQTELNVAVVAPNITYLKIDLNTSLGQTVLQTSVPYSPLVSIQTGSVPAGNYNLVVYDQNEAIIHSQKVVKPRAALRQ